MAAGRKSTKTTRPATAAKPKARSSGPARTARPAGGRAQAKTPAAKSAKTAGATPKGTTSAAKSQSKPKTASGGRRKAEGRTVRASSAKAAPRPSGTTAKPSRKTGNAFTVDRLHQVALLASDLDTAITFYQDVLGLPFIDRFDPPGLAFFNLGRGLRLLLSATASEATLYFMVEDIDAAVRTLSGRGVSFLHKPAMVHRDDEGRLGKKGTEEWMAFFRDPSGNLLALVTQR